MSFSDKTVIEAVREHLESTPSPVGYALRRVHAYPPDNIAVAPAVVIIPGDDTVAYGASNRQITLTLNVTIYVTPQADLARKYEDLMTWRTWLRDAFIDGVTLDNASGVAQASVTSTNIGTDTWGDADFLTITATVEVSSVEAIATSA
jgi:hypothetical protein